MDWLKFLKVFATNIVIGCALATVVMGGLGLALGGTEGLVNGAIWGAALGLVGGATSGFMWAGKYWSDFAGRFGDAWLKDQTEGTAEERKRLENGRDRSW